jgi:hypothetical protein
MARSHNAADRLIVRKARLCQAANPKMSSKFFVIPVE